MSDNVAGDDGGPAYRVPRHNGMDPATRRLALLAAGLGAALFVVIGAWSTLGGHNSPVPVISPPSGPLRVKPENPGGMKVTNNVALLGGGDASDARGDKLAPAPEAPDPQALVQKPASEPSAKEEAAQPAMTSQAEVQPAATTLMKAEAAPKARIAEPEGRGGAHSAPAAAVEPAPAPASPQASSGHVQVQLAALTSREQAEAQWRVLTRRAGHLLDSQQPAISEAVVNGHTWWRLRTGGFADTAQARAFCDRLRGAGVACSVARF